MPNVSTRPVAFPALLQDLQEELRQLEAAGLRRHPLVIQDVDGSRVTIGGRRYDCWASNDYLGLARHPALAEAAAEAARRWGIGSRASRLLAGTTEAHDALESALAAWFGVEAALVCPTGYQANLSALTALAGPKDVIVMDRLAHASLVDAARATRARLRVFHHNDAGHAAELLSRSAGRRTFLVTEGLFSMEGDRAPWPELLAAACEHGAVAYLDDAHGAFALGAGGQGTPEACGTGFNGFLYMATLGKALGCQGGFLAGPRAWIELVRTTAKTYMFTTALAVPVAAAATAALQVLAHEPQRRRQLSQRCRQLHAALGFCAPSAPSHIVPIMKAAGAADARWAVDASRRLWEQGIWAPAIRPPTVPRGTSRLRISVTSDHTPAQVEALAKALAG